ELALEDIPEWNPTHANIKTIKTAGLKAAGIVKQLLNFSRKTDQKLRPIGAVTIIKDALKFLRATIPATVKMRTHLPDKDITVMADPVQINQLLMNLCTNASQAMEETGGTLEITVENASLTENSAPNDPAVAKGEYVKLTVSDTGPGIESEIIGRIFDPYFTTKEVGKGSGMGLAVVHGIVKNHNGAITVDSEPGKSTTFTVLFPVATEKPEVEDGRPDKVPLGNETILFVDDEEAITHMTGQILERLGYKVETETSPAAALKLFQSKPDNFDLVMTDMTMPAMTGVKLSEKLKGIRPDISVIICTGHSALIDEEKAKEMGIDGYVMKPIVKSNIAIAIRAVLDKGQEK
ncbi:MAG: response regulator, partial [Desulfobacterales bacterium]|nr:response regulator [Desulfobacterales bacterium]